MPFSRQQFIKSVSARSHTMLVKSNTSSAWSSQNLSVTFFSIQHDLFAFF